jgi:cullin-4
VSGNGAKKLTIKVKSKPALPPAYLDTTWQSLESALRAVRQRKPAKHGYQELYSMVEDLCLHKFGSDTYVRLYRDVDEHLATTISSLWEQSSHASARQFLETFSSAWQEYSEQMKAIRLIFTVLDRSPKLMTHTEVPSARSLWDMGLQLFRKHLERNMACLNRLIECLLEVIREERSMGPAEVLMYTAHHDLLRMLSNLGLYTTQFEPRFLTSTSDFYTQESNDGMRTLNVPDYLAKCERRFQEEAKRSAEYLDSTTRKPLRKIIEQCLLSNHAQALIDKGLDELLDDEARLQDLARMHRLFSAVQLQPLLLKGFSVHTKAKGLALVMDDENPDLVGSLLQFKAKIDRMLKGAFENDEAFVKATRDALESFLNSRDNKPAELIAKYADKALRSTTTTDSFSVLQKTMELFRFLHAKDVFEEFYKKALAKRLLLGTSSSNDLEKAMISILKSECGGAFTNKLEGMFRDIELGRTLNTEWVRYQEMNGSKGATSTSARLETTVQVLSMGFWPTFPDSLVQLPPLLAAEQDKFKNFYVSKRQGRVLHWVNSLGHCVLKAYLPKGRWELDVSLFQAIVLLQFNEGVTSLTFVQIAEATGIQVEELTRTITSLALGKKEQRVLIRTVKGTTPTLAQSASGSKDDDGSDAEEEPKDKGASGAAAEPSTSRFPHVEDVYQVNTNWSSKKLRLKINQVQIKETKKENEDAHKRVAHDRQYQIDATIVRIMKARKRLAHTLLVTELFKQLPFPAKPQDLKKRIESLIEREYLERDENDPNQYTYLA